MGCGVQWLHRDTLSSILADSFSSLLLYERGFVTQDSCVMRDKGGWVPHFDYLEVLCIVSTVGIQEWFLNPVLLPADQMTSRSKGSNHYNPANTETLILQAPVVDRYALFLSDDDVTFSKPCSN